MDKIAFPVCCLMGARCASREGNSDRLLILYLAGTNIVIAVGGTPLLIQSPSILTLGYQFDEERRRIC